MEIHPYLKNIIEIKEYINSSNIIISTKYGLCRTNTFNLKSGVHPTIITALNKTEYFKNKMKELFPEYEKEFTIIGEYINNNCKIKVTDGIHIFNIRSRHLILGVKPSMQSCENKTKYALTIIKNIHGDYYNYDKFEYKGDKGKSIIICPLHGEFKQSFTHHSSGKGCNDCGKIKTINFSRSNSEEFIAKVIKIHSNLYDYSLIDYVNCKTKVKIVCNFHGTFEQTPNSHLQGNGCPKCGVETFKGGYTRNDFIKIANERPCFLYLLKLFNHSEIFYKIGITSLSVDERFLNKSKLPYMYEVINEYICDAGCVWDLEKQLHKQYKIFKYRPYMYFGGHTECFTTELPIEEIVHYLDRL